MIILLVVAAVLGFELLRGRGTSTQKPKSTSNTDNTAKEIPPKDSAKNKSSVADSIAKTYQSNGFRDAQLKYQRVKIAYKEKWDSIRQLYSAAQLDINTLNIYIRAFKQEQEVEVWGIDKSKRQYVRLKTYKFCKSSGTLGPKRKEGDKQIPEGFYHIDRFNPESKFYLSLGLNYPNKIDKLLGDSTESGNDIFLHGDCQTIGCIPITDTKIKELYVMAVDAKATGQKKIPVTIFPARLTEANFKKLQADYKTQPQLIKFWAGLRRGYQAFEQCKRLPSVTMTPKGEYICKPDCN